MDALLISLRAAGESISILSAVVGEASFFLMEGLWSERGNGRRERARERERERERERKGDKKGRENRGKREGERPHLFVHVSCEHIYLGQYMQPGILSTTQMPT